MANLTYNKLMLIKFFLQLKSEIEGCTLFLCRSEDLNRVLGSWYWLQDNVTTGGQLHNIEVSVVFTYCYFYCFMFCLGI